MDRFAIGLSNEENQFLEENVENKSKELFLIESEIEENQNRIRMFEEHRKIIDEELQTIRRLVFVQRIDPTNDFDPQEIQRVERTIETINETRLRSKQREENLRNEIDRLNEQITTIKDQKSLNKEILDELTENLKKKDEETFALMKYTRQDDLRIKDLTNQLEEKNICSHKLKRDVEEEKLEVENLRNQLDKMAENFRRSFSQRKQLIERWETSVEELRCADREIDRLATKLVETENLSRTISNRLNEEKQFENREKKTNEFLSKILRSTEKKIFELKNDKKLVEEKNRCGETEISSLKLQIRRTSDEIQRERAAIEQIDLTIKLKSDELKKLRENLDQKRLIISTTFSTKIFEKNFENEEKILSKVQNEFSKSSSELFRLRSELKRLIERQNSIEIEKKLFLVEIRRQTTEIRRLDEKFYVQNEIFAQEDFRKETIERRLKRRENFPRRDEIDVKIRQLKLDEIEGKTRRERLEIQLKNLRDDLRSNENQIEILTKNRNDLNETFRCDEFFIDAQENRRKKLQNEIENFRVEENFLRLELKNFFEVFRNSAQRNLTFENEKIELEKSIRRRRNEIEANFQIFRSIFNDERKKRGKTSNELVQLRIRIEKLKNRYDFLTSNDESIRQNAKNVIEFAQMKENFLAQGDRLETSIIKAEREIRALENTLKILSMKNIEIKKSFDVTTTSKFEMRQLEMHRRVLDEQIRCRKENLSNLRFQIDQLENRIGQTTISRVEKSRLRLNLQNEIEQIELKIDRAEKFIRKFQCENEQIDAEIRQRVQMETNDQVEHLIRYFCLNNDDRSLAESFEEFSKKFDRPIVSNSFRQFDKFIHSKNISTLINVEISRTTNKSD